MRQRKATMRDIPAMLELINSYASEEIMLPRTAFEIAESLRDFIVVERDERIAGCGALHFYTPWTGEIRSVAVLPGEKGHGIGRKLAVALEAEAMEYSLDSIFAFTYVPEFFRKLGYSEVDRDELPLKAWKDCMRCPKFQCCDETAMIKYLVPESTIKQRLQQAYDVFPVQLPVLRK